MTKGYLQIAMILLVLPIFVLAADEAIAPASYEEITEPTIVAVNSNKWQDAYLASIYASLNDLQVRFIQDPFQTQEFMRELSTNRVTRVILFSRNDNPVPSFTYLLHSQNLDVRETKFSDHFELSAKILEMQPSSKAIVIRDDFGFDALSSKYLSNKLRAPVVFSKGPEEMDDRVMRALEASPVSEIYLIGRPSESLEGKLSKYKLNKLQGRDEFDTNNIANGYALASESHYQGLITTGEIYELALMNVRKQPIFLVPDYGSYSLTKTSQMILDADIKIMLGIGKLITGPGTWLKERTNAKLMVKFGTVRTQRDDAGFVKQDLNINLEGYPLPVPIYDGKVTEINPSYTDPFGPSTGALIARDKPAPPVQFVTVFEDTGNIDFPVYIILEIRDEADALITTLQSDRQMVYPKRGNVFRINWENAPQEGKYKVEAKVFGDVYEGISLPGKKTDFELRWIFVIISLLLLLVAILMLFVLAYSSHVISRDILTFGGLFRKAGEQIDGLIKYVVEVYHFRTRPKKK